MLSRTILKLANALPRGPRIRHQWVFDQGDLVKCDFADIEYRAMVNSVVRSGDTQAVILQRLCNQIQHTPPNDPMRAGLKSVLLGMSYGCGPQVFPPSLGKSQNIAIVGAASTGRWYGASNITERAKRTMAQMSSFHILYGIGPTKLETSSLLKKFYEDKHSFLK